LILRLNSYLRIHFFTSYQFPIYDQLERWLKLREFLAERMHNFFVILYVLFHRRLWIIEDMNITNYCLILSLGFVLVKFMISGG
jgi:hypothetical protein